MPSFRKSLLLIFFGVMSSLSLWGQSIELRLKFIDQCKLLAVQEQERASIPASITLAQAIFETGWGRSTLAKEANNFFGIKCAGAKWKGETYYREDDDRDASGILIKSCFRKYKSVEESFTDRSAFLRGNQRYGRLFTDYALTDYRGWAYGLVRAGYATKVSYGDDLIGVIERNNLQRFDKMRVVDILAEMNGSGTPTNPNSPPIVDRPTTEKPRKDEFADLNGVFRRNDVKAIVVVGRPTLEQVAGRYEVSVGRLLDYNEKIGSPIQPLKDSTIVYLQRKRSFTLDREIKEHYVKPNETMYDIAQLYGIRLSKLLKKNKMEEGEEPAFRQKIVLRKGWFETTQKPTLRDIRLDRPIGTPTATYPSTYPQNGQNGQNGQIPIIDSIPSRPKTDTKPNNGDELDFDLTPGGTTGGTNENPDGNKTPQTEPYPYPNPNPTPYPIPTPPQVSDAIYYTVKRGDSLYGISRQFGVSVQEIQRLSNLGTSTTIIPNQRLRIR